MNTMSRVRYQITRIEPDDGVMGVHEEPFGPDDLGKRYGAGLYEVMRLAPGEHPLKRTERIAITYGPPRMPSVPFLLRRMYWYTKPVLYPRGRKRRTR